MTQDLSFDHVFGVQPMGEEASTLRVGEGARAEKFFMAGIVALGRVLQEQHAAGRADGVSNGLSGERKFRFFEELIKEDDELPHHGGEGYFLWLTGGDEALVKHL